MECEGNEGVRNDSNVSRLLHNKFFLYLLIKVYWFCVLVNPGLNITD